MSFLEKEELSNPSCSLRAAVIGGVPGGIIGMIHGLRVGVQFQGDYLNFDCDDLHVVKKGLASLVIIGGSTFLSTTIGAIIGIRLTEWIFGKSKEEKNKKMRAFLEGN